jgi:prophage antirepressor-like protein
MENVKIENWNGYNIRFIEKDGEWWAVAKDVADALGYSNSRDAIRKHVDEDDKNSVAFCDGNRGNPNQTIIRETGIYALIFGSEQPNAREFKKWVYTVIKSLRQAIGLEACQAMRMLSVENQKKGNAILYGTYGVDKRAYCKAATIAGKEMANRMGFEKAVKKDDIPSDMLPMYDEVFQDTVSLMALNEKYRMGISVSKQIYQRKESVS